MAVKIIKAGNVPADRVMQCDCRECGCVFTFLAADAVRVGDQRDGDFYSIACPTCGTRCTKAVQ